MRGRVNIIRDKFTVTIFSLCGLAEFGLEKLGTWVPNIPEKQAMLICVFPGPFSGFLLLLPIILLRGSPWSDRDSSLSDPLVGTLATASFPYTVHRSDDRCDISFLFSLKEILRQKVHSSRKCRRPSVPGWLQFTVRWLALSLRGPGWPSTVWLLRGKISLGRYMELFLCSFPLVRR